MTETIPYISKTTKKIVGDMEIEYLCLTVQAETVDKAKKIFDETWDD